MDVRGSVSVHARGFGFLEWTEEDGRGRSAFISPEKLRPYLHMDRVSATVEEDEKGLAVRSMELVSRPRKTLFGRVREDRKGRKQLEPDPEVSNQPVRIVGSDASLHKGMHVVGDLVDGGVHVRAEVPDEALDLQRIRDRYLIRHPFPPAVLDSARETRARRSTGWRDLRDLTTVTIDAPSSKDLDDALSVSPADEDGAIRVFVHIADVDSVVHEGSEVDQEARERGTSVYLAGGMTPMLPRSLSEDLLSLVPGKDRRTLTVEMRIDAEGDTRSVDIYPSTICSSGRLSYVEVDTFLRGKELDKSDDILETLSWLRTLSGRLAAVRSARGGIVFDRHETWVELDDDLNPVEVHARQQTPAHLLIERTMVATNEAVAHWLADRGLPGVFRVHPAPDEARVNELEDSLERMGFSPGLTAPLSPRAAASLRVQLADAGLEAVLQEVMATVLDRARYTTVLASHFGLGSAAYLHFTSPIRRYADLTVHRIVKAFLSGDRSSEPHDPELEALAEHLNDCAARSAKAEAARRRTLVARWASDHVGESFDGHVIAAKPFGIIIQLGGTGATGVVPVASLDGDWRHEGHRLLGPDDSWAIGDRIRVKIDSIDGDRGRIDLVPEARKKRRPSKRRRRKRRR